MSGWLRYIEKVFDRQGEQEQKDWMLYILITAKTHNLVRTKFMYICVPKYIFPSELSSLPNLTRSQKGKMQAMHQSYNNIIWHSLQTMTPSYEPVPVKPICWLQPRHTLTSLDVGRWKKIIHQSSKVTVIWFWHEYRYEVLGFLRPRSWVTHESCLKLDPMFWYISG